MTVEERLARLEERVTGQGDWLQSIASDVKELRSVADTGKGALVLLLKVGGVVAAVAAFAGWVFEKLHK